MKEGAPHERGRCGRSRLSVQDRCGWPRRPLETTFTCQCGVDRRTTRIRIWRRQRIGEVAYLHSKVCAGRGDVGDVPPNAGARGRSCGHRKAPGRPPLEEASRPARSRRQPTDKKAQSHWDMPSRLHRCTNGASTCRCSRHPAIVTTASQRTDCKSLQEARRTKSMTGDGPYVVSGKGCRSTIRQGTARALKDSTSPDGPQVTPRPASFSRTLFTTSQQCVLFRAAQQPREG